MSFQAVFSQAAHWTATQCGRSYTFLGAIAIILVWGASGPVFGFSDTWQLIVNTGTTIITFLMVFLIQNTQNRDTAALHLKLDELIRVTRDARNSMISLEDRSEADLDTVKKQFGALCEPQRKRPAKVVSEVVPACTDKAAAAVG